MASLCLRGKGHKCKKPSLGFRGYLEASGAGPGTVRTRRHSEKPRQAFSSGVCLPNLAFGVHCEEPGLWKHMNKKSPGPKDPTHGFP